MVACLNACLVMSDSVTESKLALLTVNPRDEVLGKEEALIQASRLRRWQSSAPQNSHLLGSGCQVLL